MIINKFEPFGFQHNFEGETTPNPVIAPAPLLPPQQVTPQPPAPAQPETPPAPAPQIPQESEFDRLKKSHAFYQNSYQNTLAYLNQRFGPEAVAEVKQVAQQPTGLWNAPQPPAPPQPQYQPPAPQQIPNDLRIADLTPQEFAQLNREIIRGEMTTVQQQSRLEMALAQERQIVGGMVGEAIKNYSLSETEAKEVMDEASSLFSPEDFRNPGQLTKYGKHFAMIAYTKRLEALARSGQAGVSTQVAQASAQLAQTSLPPGNPAPPVAQLTPVQQQLERLRNAAEGNTRVDNVTKFVRGT